jgi:hypothetical protein
MRVGRRGLLRGSQHRAYPDQRGLAFPGAHKREFFLLLALGVIQDHPLEFGEHAVELRERGPVNLVSLAVGLYRLVIGTAERVLRFPARAPQRGRQAISAAVPARSRHRPSFPFPFQPATSRSFPAARHRGPASLPGTSPPASRRETPSGGSGSARAA